MKNNDVVYLVRQYQPMEEYIHKTIYVFDDEQKAIEACRILNKTYGVGCRLSKYGDFIEVIDYDEAHYYSYEVMKLNEEVVASFIKNDYKYVIEIYQEGSHSFRGEYLSNIKNELITNNINNAKVFNTWEEASELIDMIGRIGAYDTCRMSINRLNELK